ncbi:uncharacterized protein TNCV_2181481 [Trichonephila clavipes]|uniref:Mutator-like transposase domain-containing protein n=1 Tax=Trichonephila clavipes TaxID=2585209 RepID=A0A8X6VUX2_TRICX|nr:uncharacterized protein TNCV_2181481 [Trichonephila clavipes]
MRSIGKGADAGRMFCGIMNFPQPPTWFSPYGKRVLNVAKLVYEDSIQNAAMEAICENGGKAIYVDILSKYCTCKNLPFHEKDRKRNYVGTSGAMEIQGNEYPIEKLECIGHVRKRMGTRICRLKAQLKGQILSDGKCLRGQNRLTEHEIDNLQSYYGSANRRNHSSVQKMRQAIWANFCISYQLMNILNMVFVPSVKIHSVYLKRLKNQMSVEPGEYSVSAMKLLDRERLMKAIYAFSGRSKKIRKVKEEKERRK